MVLGGTPIGTQFVSRCSAAAGGKESLGTILSRNCCIADRPSLRGGERLAPLGGGVGWRGPARAPESAKSGARAELGRWRGPHVGSGRTEGAGSCHTRCAALRCRVALFPLLHRRVWEVSGWGRFACALNRPSQM